MKITTVIRYRDLVARLILSDCAKILPIVGDACVTDPPYQIGKSWNRTFHGSNGKSRLWDGVKQDWDSLQPVVLSIPKMYDKCVIFGGNFYNLPATKCWYIWDKLQRNRGAEVEMAWVKLKDGVPKVFGMSRIDAYVNKSEGHKKIHPTQKPLPLIRWCLENLHLSKGQTVVDPFMGSGTTCIASFQKGLNFIGIEQDSKYYNDAVVRIREWAHHSQ